MTEIPPLTENSLEKQDDKKILPGSDHIFIAGDMLGRKKRKYAI
jgi:hypothetical protein